MNFERNVFKDDVLMARLTEGFSEILDSEHHRAFSDAPETGRDLRLLPAVVR